MRRTLALCSISCLLVGSFVGGILPMPWDPAITPPPAVMNAVANDPSDASEVSSCSSSIQEAFSGKDNIRLLDTAYYLVQALKDEDYAALACFVHPERGVTFTPYSTVDFDTDRTLSQNQINELATDKTVYAWGYRDGRGDQIDMTISQYFETYVFNTDYTKAPQIGVDQVMMGGNALENLTEAYPDCRFIDFCFPQLDPANQGLDWCSLKLIFEPGETNWLLVGVIHSQWTI